MRLSQHPALACCALLLCGNRAPPTWQGLIEHRSFNASVECVRDTLTRFGVASVSRGFEPEYGDARVFLRGAEGPGPSNPLFAGVAGAKGLNPRVMVALTRAPDALPIYMDAVSAKSSRRLWRSVVRQCGVTDFGR